MESEARKEKLRKGVENEERRMRDMMLVYELGTPLLPSISAEEADDERVRRD